MDRTSRTTPTDTATLAKVSSPAKVNLVLRILDRRPDGYHNLWSLMQTVGLADDLFISLDPSSTDIHLSCAHPEVPLGPTNLIHRAARAVLDRAGIEIGLHIELEKRIPMGAGLGGGSSNAAATVLGLNRLLGLKWTAATMTEVTASLGSDIPFFFSAPTAIISGRGERVTPLRMTGSRTLLLVNPGFGVETAWAYRTLAAGRSQSPRLAESLQRLTDSTTVDWGTLSPLMENDFEPVVFAAHPTLAAIKAALLAAGAESAFLSGTGATVFGVFQSKESAALALERLEIRPEWKAWVVPTAASPLAVQAVS
ncbi:4-diphosphocytidyl-2-C-methyl-D-erythritol kinase [Nitrospira sp.]|nr:4-diphosphocytidyl-2-C-methyl-D-erythritol kinase [Nitrospira sp.]